MFVNIYIRNAMFDELLFGFSCFPLVDLIQNNIYWINDFSTSLIKVPIGKLWPKKINPNIRIKASVTTEAQSLAGFCSSSYLPLLWLLWLLSRQRHTTRYSALPTMLNTLSWTMDTIPLIPATPHLAKKNLASSVSSESKKAESSSAARLLVLQNMVPLATN